MLIHWIWLAAHPDVNDWEKVELLRHFRDPEDIFFAAEDAFDHIEGLSRQARNALRDKDLQPAEKILEQCDQAGICILTYRDAAYPTRLKNIADPPLVIYYKGRLPDFDRMPMIGIVGTRKTTPYGVTVAKRMGFQIARCGGIVVSGMAFGIDGVAMQSALSAGGMVVGVLGCGADIVYPLSNRSLFADTERYGCIMSEFPPGTPAYGWNFPKRNRIISGLSCGVLVVEAPAKSGSLITARQAADQGRDVFVVPGNIDMPTFAGSNRLLRDGAIAVSSGWDVMSEYAAQYPDKIHRDDSPGQQTGYTDEVERINAASGKKLSKVAQKVKIPGKKSTSKTKIDKKVIDNEPDPPYSDVNKARPVLTSEQQSIADALCEGARLVDDVVSELGLPAGKVLSELTIMEINGIVRRLPGNRISLQ